MTSLIEMIQQDPEQSGYLATFWTVAMLVLALAEKLRRASQRQQPSARRCIRPGWPGVVLGWRCRAKTDPQKAAKQWAIAQAVIEAGPEATVLYADESRIELLPLIRAMWHWVGQQIRVPTPGSNETRSLFGALNIRTGQWTYLVREHMYKEDFIVFLEHLLTVYATGPIILIVDNYSSHTAGVVQRPGWPSIPAPAVLLAEVLLASESGREHLAAPQGPDRRQSLVRLAATPARCRRHASSTT